MLENSTLIACNGKITRAELANVPIPSENHVEPIERVHFGVQGTRSHSAVSGDGEARPFS